MKITKTLSLQYLMKVLNGLLIVKIVYTKLKENIYKIIFQFFSIKILTKNLNI